MNLVFFIFKMIANIQVASKENDESVNKTKISKVSPEVFAVYFIYNYCNVSLAGRLLCHSWY